MGTAAWDDVSWGAKTWSGTSWNENAEEWPAEAMSAQTWAWPEEAMLELQSNEVMVDYRVYNIPPGFTDKTLGQQREAAAVYHARRFRECTATLVPTVWEVW